MKRCGKVPFTSLEDHIQLMEDKTRLEEKVEHLTQEVEKLKSTNTAFVLPNTRIPSADVSSSDDETIEKPSTSAFKSTLQKSSVELFDKREQDRDLERKNDLLQQENKELMKKLAEYEKLLARNNQ